MKHEHVSDVILDASSIAQGVSQVAAQLNQDFDEAVIITVVPGGILYTADLTRQLTFDLNMDYISCPHTPGDRNNHSPIVFHNNIDISNRHINPH